MEVYQKDSSRLVERARRTEAGEGIEDEDGVGSGATAAGKDRRAADSAVRTGVSMVWWLRWLLTLRHDAPWTAVWLEVEERD